MKAERHAFEAQQVQVRPEQIIALDEMGIVTGMCRRYGYAPRGNGPYQPNWQRKGRA